MIKKMKKRKIIYNNFIAVFISILSIINIVSGSTQYHITKYTSTNVNNYKIQEQWLKHIVPKCFSGHHNNQLSFQLPTNKSQLNSSPNKKNKSPTQYIPTDSEDKKTFTQYIKKETTSCHSLIKQIYKIKSATPLINNLNPLTSNIYLNKEKEEKEENQLTLEDNEYSYEEKRKLELKIKSLELRIKELESIRQEEKNSNLILRKQEQEDKETQISQETYLKKEESSFIEKEEESLKKKIEILNKTLNQTKKNYLIKAFVEIKYIGKANCSEKTINELTSEKNKLELKIQEMHLIVLCKTNKNKEKESLMWAFNKLQNHSIKNDFKKEIDKLILKNNELELELELTQKKEEEIDQIIKEKDVLEKQLKDKEQKKDEIIARLENLIQVKQQALESYQEKEKAKNNALSTITELKDVNNKLGWSKYIPFTEARKDFNENNTSLENLEKKLIQEIEANKINLCIFRNNDSLINKLKFLLNTLSLLEKTIIISAPIGFLTAYIYISSKKIPLFLIEKIPWKNIPYIGTVLATLLGAKQLKEIFHTHTTICHKCESKINTNAFYCNDCETKNQQKN